jgi:ferric-dicitrate binding protein FerR (iron transport regulator)
VKTNFNDIEELLTSYLSGDLTDENRVIIENWRQESSENEKLFHEMQYGWNAIPILQEMEQFNSFEALKKINPLLEQESSGIRWLKILQRIAAILIIPLVVYAAYMTISNISLKRLSETESIIQTISSRQGMVSQLTLSDGTKVWLNSGSTLQFPLRFTGKKRLVKLTGEAYFEVAKNENHPFLLNANELNVEVLGTSFNVVSYDDESISEVVLVTGKVKLFAESDNREKQFGFMHPGQRVMYSKKTQKVAYEEVDVKKYISWRNGDLIFKDDSMNEVVKRLSRWFNVEISVVDPEINDYIYKATFSDETLSQVLYLLKISAPIDYRIIESKPLPNGKFTKQKVILMKKKE